MSSPLTFSEVPRRISFSCFTFESIELEKENPMHGYQAFHRIGVFLKQGTSSSALSPTDLQWSFEDSDMGEKVESSPGNVIFSVFQSGNFFWENITALISSSFSKLLCEHDCSLKLQTISSRNCDWLYLHKDLADLGQCLKH